jgi:UPF0755 protein
MIDELGFEFEDDYERSRHRRAARGGPTRGRRPPKRRRGRSFFTLFMTLILLATLGLGGWYGVKKVQDYFSVKDYDGSGDGSVTIQVVTNDSATIIANKLYDAEVVKSAKAFVVAADANPASRGIEVGYYKLHKHMKASMALDMLLARGSDNKLLNKISSQVTITEGMISVDVFTALAKATNLPVTDFQNAAKDPVALGVSADWFTRQDGKQAAKTIEGFLYPATYDFDPGMDATSILKKIVGNFNAEMTKLDFLNQAQSNLHISPYEALVAASIAQVEGSFPDDMAGISRVLYNRAYGGSFPCTCLQLDSTVNYWLRISGHDPKSSKDLTQSELHNPKDPYNTHDQKGMPIGPISNPGADALKGAMAPPKNNNLYFVAIDKAGHTAFATTFAQHQQNIALARKNGVL